VFVPAQVASIGFLTPAGGGLICDPASDRTDL